MPFISLWMQPRPNHYRLFRGSMNATTLSLLKEIGQQLDRNIYPVANDGGFVTPCKTAAVINQGEDSRYENERPKRSETRPWQRATTWQRSTDKTTPLVCPDVVKWYQSEQDALSKAYPKTQVWKQPEGLIVLTESAILKGLSTPAIFVISIPMDLNLRVKGWGFWGISNISVEWIGPRHTNFPDGSICAFEPADNTWRIGDSLIDLIDYYTLWALRHLYLREYRSWPGHQSIHWQYERFLEVKSEEYCGCENFDNRYGECCEANDKKSNLIKTAIRFMTDCYDGHRRPPNSISQFAVIGNSPPALCNLYQPERRKLYGTT